MAIHRQRSRRQRREPTGKGKVGQHCPRGVRWIILGLDKVASFAASRGRVLGGPKGIAPACPGDQLQPAMLSPFAAYVSAVTFNVTNPLSPILIVGLLAPIIGQSAPLLGGAAALLFGMFAAATTWWVCLSGGIALLRSWLRKPLGRSRGSRMPIYQPLSAGGLVPRAMQSGQRAASSEPLAAAKK